MDGSFFVFLGFISNFSVSAENGNDSVKSQKNTFAIKNEHVNHLEYINDDVVYHLNDIDKTASVFEVRDTEIEELIIPHNIVGYTVIKVENRAFGKAKYKKLKRIILPDSITELDERAFNFCPELIEIKLPEHLEKMGNECFRCCSNLNNIKIPDTVDSIGEDAFFSCISLENVNIPKSLKSLEKGIFRHCISLNGVNIHKNIEKISVDAFSECGTNLKLKKTIVDNKNSFYAMKDSSIIDKRNGKEVMRFTVFGDEYQEKLNYAKKLYDEMQSF